MQHLKIRPCEPEDLELLYTIENDPDIWDSTDTEGFYSHYALKNYIASAGTIHECGQLRLIIETEVDGQSKGVGIIDLTDYSPLNARAEIGIALLKEYRGKGLSANALRIVENYAAKRLHIHQLYAYVSPRNKNSWNLFSHNGYKLTARLPEWQFEDGEFLETALFTKIF